LKNIFGSSFIAVNNKKVSKMSEEIKEKDNSILYIALAATVFIGVLLAVKSSETDKFAPIKAQLNEENKMMNIRVLN
jgi:hypothetical protein